MAATGTAKRATISIGFHADQGAIDKFESSLRRLHADNDTLRYAFDRTNESLDRFNEHLEQMTGRNNEAMDRLRAKDQSVIDTDRRLAEQAEQTANRMNQANDKQISGVGRTKNAYREAESTMHRFGDTASQTGRKVSENNERIRSSYSRTRNGIDEATNAEHENTHAANMAAGANSHLAHSSVLTDAAYHRQIHAIDESSEQSYRWLRTAQNMSGVTLGLGATFVKGAHDAANLQQTLIHASNMAHYGGEKLAEVQHDMNAEWNAGTKAATEYGIKQQDIVNGYETMVERGYSTKEALHAQNAMMQASISSGDKYSDVVENATNAMDAFGMRTNNTTLMAAHSHTALNEMAYAADQTATNFKSLGMAMQYAAPMADACNQSLATTSTALGILSNNGLQATVAGTSLARVMQRFVSVNGKGQQAQVMQSLGLTEQDFKTSSGHMKNLITLMGIIHHAMIKHHLDSQEQAADLNKFFGMYGFKAAKILMNHMRQFRKLNGQVEKAPHMDHGEGYIAKLAHHNMKSAKSSIKQFKASLNALAITAARYLLPTFTKIAKALAKFVQAMGKWPKSAREALVVTSLLVAGIAPLAGAIFGFKQAVLGAKYAVLSLKHLFGHGVSNTLANSVNQQTTQMATDAAKTNAATDAAGLAGNGFGGALGKARAAGIENNFHNIDPITGLNERRTFGQTVMATRFKLHDINRGIGSRMRPGLSRIARIGGDFGTGSLMGKPTLLARLNPFNKSVSLLHGITGKAADSKVFGSATGMLSRMFGMAPKLLGGAAIGLAGIPDFLKAYKTKNRASQFKHWGSGIGTIAGGAIGTAFGGPVVGTAIGAGIGGMFGHISGSLLHAFSKSKLGHKLGHVFGPLGHQLAKGLEGPIKSIGRSFGYVKRGLMAGLRPISQEWHRIFGPRSKQDAKTWQETCKAIGLAAHGLGVALAFLFKIAAKLLGNVLKYLGHIIAWAMKAVHLAGMFIGAWGKAAFSLGKSFTHSIQGLIYLFTHLGKVGSAVAHWVGSKFSGAAHWASSRWHSASSWIGSKMHGLGSVASSVANSIKNFFVNAFESLSSTVSGIISGLKDKISDLASAVAHPIKTAEGFIHSHAAGGAIPQDEMSLVNENGQESAYNPHTNSFRMLGGNGPQVLKLYAGEHVLDAQDTHELLTSGLGKGVVLPGYVNGTDSLDNMMQQKHAHGYFNGTAQLNNLELSGIQVHPHIFNNISGDISAFEDGIDAYRFARDYTPHYDAIENLGEAGRLAAHEAGPLNYISNIPDLFHGSPGQRIGNFSGHVFGSLGGLSAGSLIGGTLGGLVGNAPGAALGTAIGGAAGSWLGNKFGGSGWVKGNPLFHHWSLKGILHGIRHPFNNSYEKWGAQLDHSIAHNVKKWSHEAIHGIKRAGHAIAKGAGHLWRGTKRALVHGWHSMGHFFTHSIPHNLHKWGHEAGHWIHHLGHGIAKKSGQIWRGIGRHVKHGIRTARRWGRGAVRLGRRFMRRARRLGRRMMKDMRRWGKRTLRNGKRFIRRGTKLAKRGLRRLQRTVRRGTRRLGKNMRRVYRRTLKQARRFGRELMKNSKRTWNRIKKNAREGYKTARHVFNSIKKVGIHAMQTLRKRSTHTWNDIKKGALRAARTIKSKVGTAIRTARSKARSAWSAIKSGAATAAHTAEHIIEGIVRVAEEVAHKVESILSHIHMPHFANGGPIHQTTMALVGEHGMESAYNRATGTIRFIGTHGPQITTLLAGERVLTNEQTERLLHGGLGRGIIMPGFANGKGNDLNTEGNDNSRYHGIQHTYSIEGQFKGKTALNNMKLFGTTAKRLWSDITDTLTTQSTGARRNVTHEFGSMSKGVNKFIGDISNTLSQALEDIVSGYGTQIHKLIGITKKDVESIIAVINRGIKSLDKVLSAFGGNNHVIHEVHYARGTVNGHIAHNQFGILNDAAFGPRQEAIVRGNQLLFPQGRNVHVPLMRGDVILNGQQTEDLLNGVRDSGSTTINHYAKGTDPMKEFKQIEGMAKIAKGALKSPKSFVSKYITKNIKPTGRQFNQDMEYTFMKPATKLANPWTKAMFGLINSILNPDVNGGSAGNLNVNDANGSELLAEAEKLARGAHYRYVWGASGPSAYDCGGLVLAALDHLGYHLTDRATIIDHFQRESRRNARPGDLVMNSEHEGIVADYGAHHYFSAFNPSEGIKMYPLDQTHWTAGNPSMYFARIPLPVQSSQQMQKPKNAHARYLNRLVKRELGNSAISRLKKDADILGLGGSMDNPGGSGVNRFIPEILQAAEVMHAHVTPELLKLMLGTIMNESGGQTGASNNWDCNAGANHSVGLFQYTLGTWDAYALPGHSDRTNAYDNFLTFFNNSDYAHSLVAYDSANGKSGGEWDPAHGSGPGGTRRFSRIPAANGGWADKAHMRIFGEAGPEVAINPARDTADHLIVEAIGARMRQSPQSPIANLVKSLGLRHKAHALINGIKGLLSGSSHANERPAAPIKIEVNNNITIQGKTDKHATNQIERQVEHAVKRAVQRAALQTRQELGF